MIDEAIGTAIGVGLGLGAIGVGLAVTKAIIDDVDDLARGKKPRSQKKIKKAAGHLDDATRRMLWG